MRRKKGTEQDAPAVAGARITPEEVQQVEFRLAFRGYNERDVDAFLDRITEDLSAYIADGQAVGRGIAGSAAVGAEAEQILAGARAEADEILERARRDAANIRATTAPAGTVSGDTRAAVAPFLNSEREFLQSLGSLVQTHAEEIRQMVMTLRSRAETMPEGLAGRAVPEPPAVREEASAAEQPQAPPVEAAPVSEIRARLEAAGPVPELRLPDANEAPGEPDDSGPVVVEGGAEAVYSAEGSPAGEQRERSLRELFWGED
jgi:DivIVA domain-containing protein